MVSPWPGDLGLQSEGLWAYWALSHAAHVQELLLGGGGGSSAQALGVPGDALVNSLGVVLPPAGGGLSAAHRLLTALENSHWPLSQCPSFPQPRTSSLCTLGPAAEQWESAVASHTAGVARAAAPLLYPLL